MSSLLEEVSPFEVCLEQNRAVPTNEASVSNERCFLFFGSRYNFERPKSIIIISPKFAPSPIVKLSSRFHKLSFQDFFTWLDVAMNQVHAVNMLDPRHELIKSCKF